jgi:hypothetical protein
LFTYVGASGTQVMPLNVIGAVPPALMYKGNVWAVMVLVAQHSQPTIVAMAVRKDALGILCILCIVRLCFFRRLAELLLSIFDFLLFCVGENPSPFKRAAMLLALGLVRDARGPPLRPYRLDPLHVASVLYDHTRHPTRDGHSGSSRSRSASHHLITICGGRPIVSRVVASFQSPRSALFVLAEHVIFPFPLTPCRPR